MHMIRVYFGKKMKSNTSKWVLNFYLFLYRIPVPFTCTLRPRSKEIEALIRSSGNEECVQAFDQLTIKPFIDLLTDIVISIDETSSFLVNMKPTLSQFVLVLRR